LTNFFSDLLIFNNVFRLRLFCTIAGKQSIKEAKSVDKDRV